MEGDFSVRPLTDRQTGYFVIHKLNLRLGDTLGSKEPGQIHLHQRSIFRKNIENAPGDPGGLVSVGNRILHTAGTVWFSA